MSFEFLPDKQQLEIAHQRGEFRLAQVAINAMGPTHAEIVEYGGCKTAYQDLVQQEGVERRNLFEIMGVARKEIENEDCKRYVRWFAGEQNLSDRSVPVAYEVGINIQEGRLAYGDSRKGAAVSSPIYINTHIMHRPEEGYSGKETGYFTGELIGMVIFNSDAVSKRFSKERLTLCDLKDIEGKVISDLQDQGRAAALAPWANSLLSLPPPQKTLESHEKFFGLHDGSPIRNLLFHPPQDEQAALTTLCKVLSPGNFEQVYNVFMNPIPELAACVDRYGIQDRFNWFMGAVVQMRKEAEEMARHKVIFEFKDAFYAHLKQCEVPKMEFLRNLVNFLSQAKNIAHCAPNTSPIK